MKSYTEKNFEAQAKARAKMFNDINDPLVFEGVEINEDGTKEAFFHDSKCVYYIDEDLEFHYACAR